MTSIKEVFHMVANMESKWDFRVVTKGGIIYQGSYTLMPESIRQMKVIAVDIDNDLHGCVFTVLPA